jgi:hypothetical protein
MSSDRDRFDDRGDEGSGWQEPAHLGQGGGQGGQPPADRPAEPAGWEPPGWSLPPAEQRDGQDAGYTGPPPTSPFAGGLFGWGRRGTPSASDPYVDRNPGDWTTAQEWAARQGWTYSDGAGPQDAVLQELVATAPVRRISKDSHPVDVLRGRAGTIDLVAFDVAYRSGRVQQVQYAITAAPTLLALPRMRLTPARFWRHGGGGLLHLPSGDAEFDSRWLLLTEQDSPDLRRVLQDAGFRGLLLDTDDGDDFWTAAGHIAAIRPDGHRPLLIEHHARLLGAFLSALAGVPGDLG